MKEIYEDKLHIINQSINDTKFIKDNYRPMLAIYKVLRVWLLFYILINASLYIIDTLNIKCQWYELPSFYTNYNFFRISISILAIAFIIIYIFKMHMTLKERKYLKIWLVFPIILCFDISLPSLTSLLNLDLMIAFYQSLSISSIVNIILLFYLYSYLRDKSMIIIAIVYILYSVIIFSYLSIYFNISEINSFQSKLYSFINILQSYKIIEMITLSIVALIFRKKSVDEK